MAKSLTDKTLTGINWNMAKTYGKTMLNIVVGIVLSRLIPPKEFGLLGMTVIFTGLADLFSTLGMGASIVKLKELGNDHIRIATSTTIVLGFLFFAVFWSFAPWIAGFYNKLSVYDTEKLISIFKVLSILFIIKGLTATSYSLIIRRIDFKSILHIELTSFVLGYSLVSILFAAFGFGVWSLVYGRLAASVISSAITLYKVPPTFKFLFKKKEFMELFTFGSGVSISKLVNYAGDNMDYLIIGKFLPAVKLGLYRKAYNQMTLPITQVSSSIFNVLFPAFSKVQDEKEKLRTAYLRTVKTVAFLLFPVLAAMLISGEYIIIGLFGPNWAGAVNVFKILVIAGFFRVTLSYSGAVALATGRIYTEVAQQTVYVLLLTGGAFLGVKYGIEGVGLAVVIALAWLFIAQSYLAIKIIESNWINFLKSLVPGLGNAAFMILVNIAAIYFIELLVSTLPMPVKLIIIIFICAVTFLAAILFMPSFIKNDAFSWLLEKYDKRIPKKFQNIYFKFNAKR